MGGFAKAALLIASLILPSTWLRAAESASCQEVRVGAIRWDAWHGDDSVPGKAVERSLGHKAWKDRWPDFTRHVADEIQFDGSDREVVEREMRLADGAGIDFWAFVFYGTRSPMARILRRFLDSEVEGPLFTLIIEFGRLVAADGDELANEARIVMRHPQFLRDKGGRPLLFVWVPAHQVSTAILEAGFGKLQTAGSTAPKPTFVIMSFAAQEAARVARLIGAESISTYAWHDNPRGAPYAALAQGTESMWERQAQTGSRVVPVVMSGWDPRPRVANPVPWGAAYPEGSFYLPARPDELTVHLRSAIQWARHPGHGACSVLIYAWNEFDEGGWIAPTLGGDTARLDAVRVATGRSK